MATRVTLTYVVDPWITVFVQAYGFVVRFYTTSDSSILISHYKIYYYKGKEFVDLCKIVIYLYNGTLTFYEKKKEITCYNRFIRKINLVRVTFM